MKDCLTAEMAIAVDVALRWRVDDQHTARRTCSELIGGLILREVEAPGPRGNGNAASQSEERHAADLGAFAVQDARTTPPAAGGTQGLVGLVVARNDYGRRLDHHQHVDELLQATVHRREVTGRNHDVHLARALSQTPGLAEVAVNVAERQHAHQSAKRAVLRS